MIEILKKLGRKIKEDWEKTNRFKAPTTAKPLVKPTPQPPRKNMNIIYIKQI